jgi:hypothetical protein
LNLRLGRVQQMIGVNAVNDINLMPGVAQRMAQAIEIHRVATEAVGRIEGCEV